MGDENCLSRFRTPFWHAGQYNKNGAVVGFPASLEADFERVPILRQLFDLNVLRTAQTGGYFREFDKT